jgi:hypothetical protein
MPSIDPSLLHNNVRIPMGMFPNVPPLIFLHPSPNEFLLPLLDLYVEASNILLAHMPQSVTHKDQNLHVPSSKS